MKKKNKQESSKIRINENLEMNIQDVLIVNDFSELGEFVSSEEFCKSLDGMTNGI